MIYYPNVVVNLIIYQQKRNSATVLHDLHRPDKKDFCSINSLSYNFALYLYSLGVFFGLHVHNCGSYKQIQLNKAALSFTHNEQVKFKINSADICLQIEKQMNYQNFD